MEFLIAGLLVLVLAVTLVNGQLLEREARRHFCEVKDLLAETNGHLMALSTEEARTEASLTAIWKTLQERKDLDKEDIPCSVELDVGASSYWSEIPSGHQHGNDQWKHRGRE